MRPKPDRRRWVQLGRPIGRVLRRPAPPPCATRTARAVSRRHALGRACIAQRARWRQSAPYRWVQLSSRVAAAGPAVKLRRRARSFRRCNCRCSSIAQERESLTDQIVGQLRQAIASAQLAGGVRLPSSRRLAEQLEVARNTVMRAYDTLMAEGWVESRPASGLFVAASEPAPVAARRSLRPPARPAARPGRCRCRRFPIRPRRPRPPARPAVARFRAGPRPPRLVSRSRPGGGCSSNSSRAAARPASPSPPMPAGLPALRSAIAAHLAATRGVAADPSRILITSGVQEGVGLAARLFLHRGTTAAIEDPCLASAAMAFEATGAEVVGVAVDADGLIPDGLPQRADRPSLSHAVASVSDRPCAVRRPARDRRRLGAALRLYILEDDSDGEFRYEGSPIKAIAATAPDCTIYLGTFSRTLGAGLELGFMVLPPRLVEAGAMAKRLFDGGGSWLEQAALAEMMQGPSYSTHVTRVRAHYRENRDVLIAALQAQFRRGQCQRRGWRPASALAPAAGRSGRRRRRSAARRSAGSASTASRARARCRSRPPCSSAGRW